VDKSFDELQAGLGAALAATRPGRGHPHVVLVVPSHGVGDSLLAHYGARIMALEHRFLVSGLATHRPGNGHCLVVGSVAPSRVVVEYYRDLGPRPSRFARRTRMLGLGDERPRPLSAKLVERPDLLERLRRLIGERPAVLESWNVTEHEIALAEALQVPVNGMHPRLRHLGLKSAARRLFREAGVPCTLGVEDVHGVDDVVRAVTDLQARRPGLRSVVVKHDDSASGDGNVVLDVAGARPGEVRDRVLALPGWYLRDLAAGAVVEEHVCGLDVRSPSAQLELGPDGAVVVAATHEQHLGGESGQVFLGCSFPADPRYATLVARHAGRVGEALARRGVVGRVGIDFVVTARADGAWSASAVDVNLRKGGTSHPLWALSHLVPGRYEPEPGRWVCDRDAGARAYSCTDNLLDPGWLGADEAQAIAAVRAAGLAFDHATGTGVVLHMLNGLWFDGRIGVTAIAADATAADRLLEDARTAIAGHLGSVVDLRSAGALTHPGTAAGHASRTTARAAPAPDCSAPSM